MPSPPSVADVEKDLLKILARQSVGVPVESSILERAAGTSGSLFTDSIAHLVSNGFIEYFPGRSGCLGALLRIEPEYFAIITPEGSDYLQRHGHTSAAQDERDRQLHETPGDQRNAIQEVVRLACDSFSAKPIYGVAKHRPETRWR